MSLFTHKKPELLNLQDSNVVDVGASKELQPQAVTSNQQDHPKHLGRLLLLVVSVLLLLVLVCFAVYSMVTRKDSSKPTSGSGQSTNQASEKIQPHKLAPLTAEQKAEQEQASKSNAADQDQNEASSKVYLLAPKDANQSAPSGASAGQGPAQ